MQTTFLKPSESSRQALNERVLALLEQSQQLAREVRGAYSFPTDSEDRPQVRNPSDAALLMNDMHALEQEEMRLVILDTRNTVLATKMVYRGTLNTTYVRVADLMRDAIRLNAAAIIVVHNHPSGDPSPSPEDVAFTKKANEAGELLGIELLDHLILGGGKHVSLKERGLGF